MENITPLQHYAKELRAEFKRAEEEKQKRQQDKLEIEGRELVNKFANSFSSLYSLLIGSNVRVDADKTDVRSVIVLACRDKQVLISLDRTNGRNLTWSLLNKTYKATMPNKDFGMAADKEDEHRLIIAIEEVLFSVKPDPAEAVFHRQLAGDPVY